MSAFASSLINWNALGRIALTALVAGGGVVVAFGFMLLGLERSRAAKSHHLRLAHRALAATCGLCCIGVLLIGIYAMADKPSPKHASEPKPKPAASLIDAGPQSPNQRVRLVAPKTSFSAAISRDGSWRCAAAAGPARKLTSTLLTSPSPNSA